MKKTLSYLLAASTACTFSFRKMEESGVIKKVSQPERYVTFVCNGEQANEMLNSLHETLGSENSEVYFAYLYDPISKYLFIARSRYYTSSIQEREIQFQSIKHCFNLLLGNRYLNLEESKKSFGVLIKDQNLLQRMTNHPNVANHPDFTQFVMTCFAPIGFLIDTNEVPEAATSIKQWVENDKNSFEFFKVLNKSYSSPLWIDLGAHTWEKEFVSPSGIKVSSTVKGVKLTKTLKDGQEKTIDFQEALGKYLETQKSSVDNFSQSLVNLFNLVEAKKRNPADLYKENITYKGTQREDSLVKEFLEKKEKFCLIEEQQKLLKGSEILTIRYIIPDEEVTDTPGKCTIIGTAIDKRTLTTFHWVTELDRDLKSLFEG